MRIAIRVEALKLRRSPVGIIATIALVGATIAILMGTTAAVASGDAQMIAKAGPGATLDWTGLLASAAQITAAGGLLGFGVVLAWLFAREFADGTITGLFALPIGRGRIAIAKLIVYGTWVIAVGCALTACLLAMGVILYGIPTADAWTGLGRQFILTVLTGAIATPTAWVATLTRSMLAGVGTTIGLVIIAQVGVLAGADSWMPLAAPALWAMGQGGGVSVWQLTLSIVSASAFAALTYASWDRLQMNR